MRVVSDRLSLRWRLGYDLHEPLPDHSSLTRIRERFGLSVFRRFFERIVQMCFEAGLVWGEELFFDATKVEANASLDSTRTRSLVEGRLEDHLLGVFPEDTLLPATDEDCPGPGGLPNEGHNTPGRYYAVLMYNAGVRLVLYIREPLGIGPGWCGLPGRPPLGSF